MVSQLDADSALTTLEPGLYAAQITDRWNIGAAPNGGYLAMIAARAMADMLPHPDPVSSTTHYLSVALPGPAQVHVEILRSGRAHSSAIARLVQERDGKTREVLRTMATFADLSQMRGPTDLRLAPPELPPLEACFQGRSAGTFAAIAAQLDMWSAPGTVSWMEGGERNDEPSLRGYVRLRDGREPDALSLIFFADAFPPPAFNLRAVELGWLPTLELTVHVRARPAPGLLRASFETRALVEGYLEEDGQLWDAEGKLVAMSRQLARAGR